jgi:hypothetical protein
MLDALGYSLSQGMTFGLGDELAAGLRTGFGTMGDYGHALDQERANLKAVQDKYPWLSFGGELAGGALTGGGAAKAGLSAAGAVAVRRQNIRLSLRLSLAECRPRLGVDVKRRACGAASADVGWSGV